ncbi:MAG: DUF305 domain-containing protein [Lachnospiraceae bacterium]|nr:DUF305 domain-containing protein [Lachnospiraceae bacterium]
MANNESFCFDTKEYLVTFYCILDKMVQEMTTANLTESISNNFIVQMIPHHQAAIQMAENLLKYSDWCPLKTMAEQIIEEQKKEIADMEALLGSCCELINCDKELCLYDRRVCQILEVMFTDMEFSRQTDSIDANFMLEMIPHHLGAVSMAENALHYEVCDGLVPILESIITSQKRGVRQMQFLLRRIGYGM